MTRNNFWNEACKYGAIIGGVMSAAFILEMSLMFAGSMSLIALAGFVWILASVAYILMLYRFTKRRRVYYNPEEGFPFGHAFPFILSMVLFAAVIKGLVEYIYRSLIIGYPAFVEKTTALLTESFAQRQVPASMETMILDLFRQIQEAPEPSILATVWSSVFLNLLLGLILGLILSAMLSRSPRPFGPVSEE